MQKTNKRYQAHGGAFGTQANHNGDSLLNKLMSHPIGATLLHFNEETVHQIDENAQ